MPKDDPVYLGHRLDMARNAVSLTVARPVGDTGVVAHLPGCAQLLWSQAQSDIRSAFIGAG
jgi:hypothetical protein